MTDSLVIGGIIELLGGGVASTHPQAAGAYFQLGSGFDLSAPQMTSEQVAGLLLDGEVVSGFRASNRTPTLPVVMRVPSTGNAQADRLTLAGARELLLQLTSEDQWTLVWTRDGADPLIFDCMGLATIVNHYSIRIEQNLVSQVDITFQAFPYARSDTQEILQFNSPAAQWSPPPSTVTVDDFTGTTNFLLPYLGQDNSTFESGSGQWVTTGNSVLAVTTAQAHAGTHSLQLTSSASGSMQAACFQAGNILTQGMACTSGDTINAKAWFRTAVSSRSCNIGVDFYDSLGTFISTVRGGNITDSTSAWTQATAAVTAPAGSAWCRPNGQVVSTGAANEVHYVDDVSLDRGPVYSADTTLAWSRSSSAAQGSFSAHWSRVNRNNPTYDHQLSAAVSISGRTKFQFWFGLGTTSNQWPVWHRGKVQFAVTLYDATGNKVSFGLKRTCSVSALVNQPHWQLVTADIPQMSSGFDYTTVTRYVIAAWNLWDPRAISITGVTAGPVLQADAYFNLVQAAATTTGSPGARGALYQLPGIKGTARSPLAIQAAPGPGSFSTVAEFTTPGSNPWTAPGGLSKVDKAEAWGTGGGGAGDGTGIGGGGGGGGGEYAMELNIPVTALGSFPATVGAAGTGGSAGNKGISGGDSFWSGSGGPQVRGHGGQGGWQSTAWGGGKGGTGSVNYVHNDGGNGWQSNANGQTTTDGGGGGSSGGDSSEGNAATSRHGAGAVYDGGPGGSGGSAGNPGNSPTSGPGGGGGGGGSGAGAAGAAGKVRLTYGATGLIPLQSLMIHVPGKDAPDTFNPLCPVGNGADTPNGATEYLIPNLGNLNARYDGTYTMYLVASSFNTPGSSRNLTVQLRQYPALSGVALTQNVVRNSLTPTTDLLGTQTYVDMGPVTLPLADLPPGSLQPYFALTVTSSNTADRFLDVVLIDTQGNLVFLNVGSGSIYSNIWIDQPDSSRDLGRILGSSADRDQSVSALQYVERFSGGPLAVYPDGNNRVFVYAAQGAPGLTAFYPPYWWTERLS
jgi:hypothetical protein